MKPPIFIGQPPEGQSPPAPEYTFAPVPDSDGMYYIYESGEPILISFSIQWAIMFIGLIKVARAVFRHIPLRFNDGGVKN